MGRVDASRDVVQDQPRVAAGVRPSRHLPARELPVRRSQPRRPRDALVRGIPPVHAGGRRRRNLQPGGHGCRVEARAPALPADGRRGRRGRQRARCRAHERPDGHGLARQRAARRRRPVLVHRSPQRVADDDRLPAQPEAEVRPAGAERNGRAGDGRDARSRTAIPGGEHPVGALLPLGAGAPPDRWDLSPLGADARGHVHHDFGERGTVRRDEPGRLGVAPGLRRGREPRRGRGDRDRPVRPDLRLAVLDPSSPDRRTPADGSRRAGRLRGSGTGGRSPDSRGTSTARPARATTCASTSPLRSRRRRTATFRPARARSGPSRSSAGSARAGPSQKSADRRPTQG